MENTIYSVKDLKGQAFMNQFKAVSDAQAARDFETVSNDPESMFYKYPEDFELWKLAVFEDSTGEFKNITHELIVTAQSFALKRERLNAKKESKQN